MPGAAGAPPRGEGPPGAKDPALQEPWRVGAVAGLPTARGAACRCISELLKPSQVPPQLPACVFAPVATSAFPRVHPGSRSLSLGNSQQHSGKGISTGVGGVF